MKFFTSPSSPFGRKVKIAAHVLGLFDELVEFHINTLDPGSGICDVNPLGKIPAVEDNGATLYDSRVIMEYLDSRAGGGQIIPEAGMDRYSCLTAAAKMDGIIDAALLMVYEDRFRPPKMRVNSFVDWQRDKIIRSLQSINPAPYNGSTMPDVADIGLACALDYLDFRKLLSWRDDAPALANWQAGFASAVPGYAETMPMDSRNI